MSAMIMRTYRRIEPAVPPEKEAADKVAEALSGVSLDPRIRSEACARAARQVSIWGRTVDDAVRMAKSWALSAIHPEPPRAA